MQPANERELVIAMIVDRFAGEARLDQTITQIDFGMTQPQGNFLIDYIRWRDGRPDCEKR